jgi:uncharacterized protein YpmB
MLFSSDVAVEILKKHYRHSLEKHSACFRTVAVVTQLSIEYGSPLYEVEYYDMSKTNEDDVDFELELDM